LESKSKRLEGESKEQAARERAISSEWAYVNQQRQGQAKKGKARLRAYETLLEESAAYVRQSTMDSIVIPIGPRLGAQVVEAKSLMKGFPSRGLLIDDLSFSLPPGARLAIVGANGAGKSTLFRMVMGQDKPDGGELVIGSTVRAMCVDQSRDGLDDAKTVFQEVCAAGGGGEEIVIAGRAIPARAYCAWYNFRGGDQQKLVGSLSGGERNRLQLAKTLLQGGNLLLLDEPTNDLDVDTLRCLEEAINAFCGSVVVISHDRWFLERIATHVLAFEGDSHVEWFEGSYSEYEADRRRRTGMADPTRIKYRPMPAIAR